MNCMRKIWKVMLIVILLLVSACKASQEGGNTAIPNNDDQGMGEVEIETNRKETDDNYYVITNTPLSINFDLSYYGLNEMGHQIGYYFARSPLTNTPAFNVSPGIGPHQEDKFLIDVKRETDTDIRKILYAYERLRFEEENLYYSAVGYEATQLAIWGKLLGKDPSTLEMREDSNAATASKVKDLSTYLYNYDGLDLENGYVHNYTIIYNNSPISKNIEASETGSVENYEGVKYYRSEIIKLFTTNTYNDKVTVSVENGFASKNGSNELSKELVFDLIRPEFYIWTPCDSQNETKITISGYYYYPEVVYWTNTQNSSEENGPDLMSMIYKKVTFEQPVIFYHSNNLVEQKQEKFEWD